MEKFMSMSLEDLYREYSNVCIQIKFTEIEQDNLWREMYAVLPDKKLEESQFKNYVNGIQKYTDEIQNLTDKRQKILLAIFKKAASAATSVEEILANKVLSQVLAWKEVL